MAPLPPAQTPPSTERLPPPAPPHGDRAAPPAPPLRRPSSALFDEDLHAALLGAEFSEISLRVARDPRASEALEAARASARRRLEPGDAPRPVARQGSLESLDLAVNGRQQQRLSVISQLRAPPRQEGFSPAPLAAVGPVRTHGSTPRCPPLPPQSEGSEASCGGEGESCDGEGASERSTTSAQADAKPKRWFGLRRRPVVVEASLRLTGGSRKHPSPRGSCSTGGRFSCSASSSVAPNQVVPTQSPQGQAPFAAQRINKIPEIQLRQPGATEGAAVVPPGAKVLPLTGRLPLPTTDASTDELTPRTLRKKVLVGERVARARAQRPSLLARSSMTGTSAGGAARHSGTMHALDLSLYAEQKEELDAIFNEGVASPQQEEHPRLDQPANRLAQTVEEMRSVELGLQLAEMEQQIASDPRAMEGVAAAHMAKIRLGASRSRADLFSQSADGSGAPVFTRLLSFRDVHADAGSGDPSAARQGSLDSLSLFVSETQQQQVDTLSELRRQRSLRMHKDSDGASPTARRRGWSTGSSPDQDLDTSFIGRAHRQWRRPSLNGTERAKVSPLLDGAELGAACSDAPPRRRGSSDATWRARIAPGGNADEPSVEPREDAPTRVFPSNGETDASGSTRRQSLARSLVKRRSSTASRPATSRQSGATRQSKSEGGLSHISGWVELGLELADAGLDAQEEAMLDYDSLQSLKAARVLRAKQANVARIRQQASATGPAPKRSSDGVGQWLSFGLELAAAEWEEGEEALLDPQSRASLIAGRVLQRRGSGRLQSPRKPTGWLDFGLELADANADMEEELELSALSRAAASAGRLLRTRHSSRLSGIGDLDSPRRPAIAPLWRDARRRIDSYERNSMIESFRITRRDTHESPRARHSAAGGAAPRPSSWLGFGLELAHAALDAEEEAELEPQTRQSLAAGRALLARGERPAAVDAGWLGLGAFLLDVGLDAEQEAALDGQARAALGASRVIRGKRGGGARAAEESPWYGLGLELLDAGVTAEVEASLDAHSRVAVKAVRWLLEKRESEASGGDGQALSSCNASDLLTFNPGEKLPSAKETAEVEALPAEQRPTGRGRARSAPPTSWLAFGLEIDALQLSAEEEAHLDGLSRAALGAVRELYLHPPLQADGSPPIEEQEALVSRSQAAVRRLRTHLLPGSGEALDSPAEAAVAPHGRAAPLTWVQLGAELMEAALPAEEEAALDPQAKAALRVARARRAAAEGAAEEGAWADLALELAALAPNGEEEAALDLRARRALREIKAPLVEAAALRGGGTCCAEREAAADGRRSVALRRDEGGMPIAEDEAALDGRRRGGSAWVEWGLELAELQLDAEEEAALDSHSRAALSAARMVRARGLSAAAAAGEAEAEGGVDAHRTARGGRGEEASLDAEAERGADSHRRSVAREAGGAVYGRWAVGDGRVESCGSHVECAAAPHARRVARDRPRLISMGLGGGVAEELEGEAVVEPHASRAPPRAWLRFGLELQGLGLSAEEEAALEPQARAALRVACMLYPPLPPADEEAPLPQRRTAATGGAPLLSMACDASVLGSEESEAMPSQSQKGRRPTAGRLLPMGCDASVVGGEDSEAMPSSQKRRPTAGRLVPMGCDASAVGGEESEAMPSSQRRRPTAGRLVPTGCDASVVGGEESEAMPSSQRRRPTTGGFTPMRCDASVVGGEESEAMPSQRRRSTAAGFVPMGCDASVVGGEESEAMPSSQGRRPTAGGLVPMGCDASVVSGEESEAIPSQGRRRTAGRLVPMGCDASGMGGEESEAMPSQERRPTAGRLVPMGCDASVVGGEESEEMPSQERRPTAGRFVSMGCGSIAGSWEDEAAVQPHTREGALHGGSLLLHGFALLDAGVEDEAALDPQSRAALGAARIVRQRGAESRGEVPAPAASATVTHSPCGGVRLDDSGVNATASVQSGRSAPACSQSSAAHAPPSPDTLSQTEEQQRQPRPGGALGNLFRSAMNNIFGQPKGKGRTPSTEQPEGAEGRRPVGSASNGTQGVAAAATPAGESKAKGADARPCPALQSSRAQESNGPAASATPSASASRTSDPTSSPSSSASNSMRNGADRSGEERGASSVLSRESSHGRESSRHAAASVMPSASATNASTASSSPTDSPSLQTRTGEDKRGAERGTSGVASRESSRGHESTRQGGLAVPSASATRASDPSSSPTDSPSHPMKTGEDRGGAVRGPSVKPSRESSCGPDSTRCAGSAAPSASATRASDATSSPTDSPSLPTRSGGDRGGAERGTSGVASRESAWRESGRQAPSSAMTPASAINGSDSTSTPTDSPSLLPRSGAERGTSGVPSRESSCGRESTRQAALAVPSASATRASDATLSPTDSPSLPTRYGGDRHGAEQRTSGMHSRESSRGWENTRQAVSSALQALDAADDLISSLSHCSFAVRGSISAAQQVLRAAASEETASTASGPRPPATAAAHRVHPLDLSQADAKTVLSGIVAAEESLSSEHVEESADVRSTLTLLAAGKHAFAPRALREESERAAALDGLAAATSLLDELQLSSEAARGVSVATELLVALPSPPAAAAEALSFSLDSLALAHTLLQTQALQPSGGEPPGVRLALDGLELSRQLLEVLPITNAPQGEGAAGDDAPTHVRTGEEARGVEKAHSTSSIVFFDEAEEAALIAFARRALADDVHVGERLLAAESPDQFFGLVSEGVLLNKLVLYVKDDALDMRALNLPTGGKVIGAEARLQNHTLCSNAATSIGCGVRGLQPHQLADANAHRQFVLPLLWNLARATFLSSLNLARRSSRLMAEVKLPHESAHDLFKLAPEHILVRWINHHVAQFVKAHPKQKYVHTHFAVENLHSDLADSAALAILLKQIAPASCAIDLRILNSTDLHQRASHVLAAAERMGMKAFLIKPEDITRPQPRLLFGFVASLYGLYSAIDASKPDQQTIKSRRAPAEREANIYHMWLVSLGIAIGDLFEDCKTGLPLLRVEAFLLSSSVRWKHVHLHPRSIFECVENCEHVCEVAAGPLRLPVRGIGGKDIADGNEKLTLAILFQLMRAHVLQLLAQLGVDGERGEERIIEWANARVAEGADDGSNSHEDRIGVKINSFSDASLGDGTFLLRLLHAVSPDSVDRDQILAATTEEQRKLNAIYAISCAHKMGCTVFVNWEDLVQVEPKMMMLVFAAAMAEDIRRKRRISTSAPKQEAVGERNSGETRRSTSSKGTDHSQNGQALLHRRGAPEPSPNLPKFKSEVGIPPLRVNSEPKGPSRRASSSDNVEPSSLGGEILTRIVHSRRSTPLSSPRLSLSPDNQRSKQNSPRPTSGTPSITVERSASCVTLPRRGSTLPPTIQKTNSLVNGIL